MGNLVKYFNVQATSEQYSNACVGLTKQGSRFLSVACVMRGHGGI
jgi:hypothetical protein